MKSIALLLLIPMSCTAAQATQPLACVPQIDFALQGISPSASVDKLKTLGRPKRIEPYESEDDGGQYKGKRETYEHIQVDYENIRGIERVATSSRSIKLPAGLQFGMPLSQVAALLHFVPIGLDHRNSIALPVCGDELESTFSLTFDNSSSGYPLMQVEIVRFGP